MHGHLELWSRSFELDSLDFNEPRFFSVIMDHTMAHLNVHWIRNQADIGQHSFHLDEVSIHLMDDADSVRALIRAIKNILEECSDARLHKLRAALDEHRSNVLAPPPERRRRGKRTRPNQAGKAAAAGRRENGAEVVGEAELQTRPQPQIRFKRATTGQADAPVTGVRTRRMAAAGSGDRGSLLPSLGEL